MGRSPAALSTLRLIVAAGLACMAWGALAQSDTHAGALQACPAIKQEIIDLDTLAEGLKKSHAVGVFEKLRLKSAIDELIDRLKAFHSGARRYSLAQLQEQYDLLMMRIASQLQDKDAALHGQLCNAWASIWNTLQDRRRFMEMLT